MDPIWKHEKCASQWPAHLDSEKLLLCWRCLGGGAFHAGEDRAIGAGTRECDGEADGGEHEDDGGPGGQFGEEVGGAAGAECCLGTLTAEGSGEVGGFALLEEDDADNEERNDNVDDYEKNDHRSCLYLLGSGEKTGENVWIGAEEGT